MRFILLFFLCCANPVLSQGFIPMDADTMEFIEDVNYHLYLNHKAVASGTCSNESKTVFEVGVAYDSISFSKVNYISLGLKKELLEQVVLLTKNKFTLDEVVIVSAKKNDLVLGEQNRLLKKRKQVLSRELTDGLVVENPTQKQLLLTKVVFYTNSVRYKTAYRIKLYAFNPSEINTAGRQSAMPDEVLLTTETLYLTIGQKGAVEIDLRSYAFEIGKQPVFIALELVDYFDANNQVVSPKTEDMSAILFQLSNQTKYFAKMYNVQSQKLSPQLMNINSWINYDFAFYFFKKPGKSTLVAPAIVCFGRKIK